MTQDYEDGTYFENFNHRTYRNKEGLWDIEIDLEVYPVGKDRDQGIEEWYLFRILGPNKELFTCKIRYEGQALATERLGLGHINDKERRIELGMQKIIEQIESRYYADLYITRSYDDWKVTLSLKGLKKHSPLTTQGEK